MRTTTTIPLATGTWSLDAAHSGVHFRVRHLGLARVRGRFKEFDATLTVGDGLEDTAVRATIALASVDTNQQDRDAHLRSTDFFSADDRPEMTFRSTAVRTTGETAYQVDGDLTINDVTKPVTLPVEFTGTNVHPLDGATRAGFEVVTQISRKDFGIDFNVPITVGGFVIADKVTIELDLEFVEPS